MSDYNHNPILVRAVQRSINECGYATPLAESGVVDDQTATALRWYQKRNGIAESGVVEDYTLAATAGATFHGAMPIIHVTQQTLAAQPDQQQQDQSQQDPQQQTQHKDRSSVPHWVLPAGLIAGGALVGAVLPIPLAVAHAPIIKAAAGALLGAIASMIIPKAKHSGPGIHGEAGPHAHYSLPHRAPPRRPYPAPIHGELEGESLTAGDIGLAGSYASLKG